eukprot:5094787-Amphidinium_carterae.1
MEEADEARRPECKGTIGTDGPPLSSEFGGILSAVTDFEIFTNSFKGTIPESGIRTMSAVTKFDFNTNSFEGVLPESGLQVMRA